MRSRTPNAGGGITWQLGYVMVIVHVVTRLLRAGSEENTIGSCLAQARAGHKVFLIHGNEWNPALATSCGSSLKLIEVPELTHAISLQKDVLAVLAMTSLFRQLRPTVVHTHQSKAGIIGRYAAHLAGVPVIVHGVHIVPFAAVGRMQKLVYLWAERSVAHCTAAFINVSEGTRQSYLAHDIGRPDQHFVAHSGFEVDRFREAPSPENWQTLCGMSDAEEKPPVVLMMAALEPRKRHVPFLEAFHRVISKVPKVRLLMAGEGPMRPAIEATIARLELQRNVRLLGFHPSPESLISLADLTVLTSMREGLPRVIVQSLAGGKPVVTTELPGLRELVSNGDNGIIAPVDDINFVADSVADLLLDSTRLRRMQASARQTDVSTWSVESMCATLSQIYQRLIPESAQTGSTQPVSA